MNKPFSYQAQIAFVLSPASLSAVSSCPHRTQGPSDLPRIPPSPAPEPEVFCKHKCINKLVRAPMNISCLTCPRFLLFNGCSPHYVSACLSRIPFQWNIKAAPW